MMKWQFYILGNFYFDMKADLTELFHWNNKQLFLYVMAEYKTEQNDINQVVVWDRIIKRGEKSKLDLKRKVRFDLNFSIFNWSQDWYKFQF